MSPIAWAKLGILALVLAIIATLAVKLNHSRTMHAKHLAADAQAALVRKDQIINTERDHMAALAAVDATLTKEYNDALADRDTTIAGLRNGTVKLRDRFQCPTAARLPGVAAGAGASDAGQETGFTATDAQVAFGIASDGDAAIIQLAACQAVVAGDRK